MSDKSKATTEFTGRRQFLKQSGFVGALAVTSGLSTQVLAENYADNTPNTSMCKFSQLASDFTYLNSGTEGSMPKCVIDHLNAGLLRWASDPTTSYESDPNFGKRQHKNRADVAALLGVEKDNICLTDNTTMGLNMVLMGLNFQANDRAIITNHEHNAIVSPLTVIKQRIGTKIITREFPHAHKLANISAAELIDYLFPNDPALRGAKALCVSHVYPTTGLRLPLNLLRKKADELEIEYLIVDGAQAFGMLDVSDGDEHISACDFYACPGHKWLNGPPSTGILYLKNSEIHPPEFYPTLSQRMYKFEDATDKTARPFPMAQALQVRGCSNAPGFSSMLRAMQFQHDIGGPKLVEQHILTLSQSVKDFIAASSPNALASPTVDPSLKSGLTVFFPFSWHKPSHLFYDKKTCDHVVAKLLEKNIQIRSIGFDEPDQNEPLYALRVSTAVFNSKRQLGIFQGALKEVLSQLI